MSIERMIAKTNNPVYSADSYKFSHYYQYPKNTTSMYDYYENRGNGPAIFTGLKYYILRYLMENPLSQEIIDDMAEDAESHGIPFNKEGFEGILKDYDGYLPLRIRAVPENKLYPAGIPLFTVESTDENYAWIVGIVETMLMKVWYPSAVATKAYNVKQILAKFFGISSDIPEAVNFGYHNFGARGSSSEESTLIAGIAHLTQFYGTDNFKSVRIAKAIYPDIIGVSIPATEHSSTTSWGKENEYDFVLNFVKTNIKNGFTLMAAVMDSYDYFNLVSKIIADDSEIRRILEENKAKLVLRPDSGDQLEILSWTARQFKNNSAFYKNSKGYYTSDTFGCIWGDGVNPQTIFEMCKQWTNDRMCMDILAFGSGGDLMQNVSRDDYKTAIKCSSITVNGEQIDVFKDPITDKGKSSKKGRVVTCFKDGEYFVTTLDSDDYNPEYDIMETVYEVAK